MPRPAVGSLELPCWTIICGSVGAVVALGVILLTAAGLSSDEDKFGLSLPVCPTKAADLTTCTSLTSAEIIDMTDFTGNHGKAGPCTVTCKAQSMATFYVSKCSDIRSGALYARCQSKGTASAPLKSFLGDTNNVTDGTYCDTQERIYADRHCYPVADKHNAKSDPHITFDKATAWETLMHLKGAVDSNRCGFLTYRDMIKVHNCHPEAFGCTQADPINDKYLNKVTATGSIKTIEGTSGTGWNGYTTCIKQTDIACGDQTTGAPAGYTWLDHLPKPKDVSTLAAKSYKYGDTRVGCPGSAAEQACASAQQQTFTCLMGVAPLQGGWRKI